MPFRCGFNSGGAGGGGSGGVIQHETASWFISVNAPQPFRSLLLLLVAATDDLTR